MREEAVGCERSDLVARQSIEARSLSRDVAIEPFVSLSGRSLLVWYGMRGFLSTLLGSSMVERAAVNR